MCRAIREIQPTWVVGENVLGLVNWDGGLVFNEVQADLEAEGYEVFPYVLPAVSVNAPHRRDRIWFVAYSNSARLQKARTEQQTTRVKQYGELDRTTPNPDSEGQQECNNAGQPGKQSRQPYKEVPSPQDWQNFPTQSPICSGDDGISTRLDFITFPKWRNESIKAAGNAIVPQVAYQIFKTIKLYNEKL
jgi:DNA (cytosine-5)-methyltransferase 1